MQRLWSRSNTQSCPNVKTLLLTSHYCSQNAVIGSQLRCPNTENVLVLQEEIIVCLQGLNPINQKEVDQKMFDLDGSDNKGKLGANAILAVSMATAKVCSSAHIILQPCSHMRCPHPA